MKTTLIYSPIRAAILLAAAVGLASGCTREPLAPGDGAVVQVHAAIDANAESTKAPISGTAFTDKTSYGIFVCEHGSTTVAHKANSWNLRAYYTDADSWRFSYVGTLSSGALSSSSFADLVLMANEEETTADLYAYAPWTQNAYAKTPAAIPFSVAGQEDLMYAQQNLANENAGLDPAASAPLHAAFSFKHAYALLCFRFKLKNQGNGTAYLLSNIKVTKDPGATTAHLYTSGSFNALTGTFNLDECVDGSTFNVNYNTQSWNYTYISSATDYTMFSLMLVPTAVADDELTFTFTVNDKVLQPFVLKADQVLHGDGVTAGFQPGYRYVFNFTLDNFLYFDGFNVESWSATDETLGEMEI